MFIRRLLFLSLTVTALVMVGSAPVAAQSSRDQNSASSPSQLDGVIAPAELQQDTTPLSRMETKIERGSQEPASNLIFLLEPGPDDASCFYIRSYRVTRDEPNSDATRFAGYTTCTSAERFRTKSAVEVLKIER